MTNMLKKMRIGFCSLLLMTMADVTIAGQLLSPTEKEIDAVVEGLVKKQVGVGTAVIVLKDGVLLFMKGYGWANLEHKVPVTPDTVFQAGSLGKMFAATGIMMLVRDGKLSLDDRLIKFFPDGPAFWQDVTIRHLLSHRGGIRNVNDEGGALEIDRSQSREAMRAQFYRGMRNEYTEEDYAKIIVNAEKTYQPGTAFEYSNEGYVLLGMIINKVSGKFYGGFLKENLFDKIGMKTSQINVNSQVIPNRAQSYKKEGGELVHPPYVSHFFNQTADGTLLFTLKDLAKWDQALHTAKHLSRQYLDQMYQRIAYPDGSFDAQNYGFAWRTSYVRGHKFVGHSGSWQGFSTYLSRYSDDGLTVAVLSNTGHANPGAISVALAGLFNPDYAAYKPLADQSTTVRMKKFTLDYLNGEANPDQYRKSAQGLLSKTQIDQTRRAIQVSAETTFTLVDQHVSGENISYTYRMTEEDGYYKPTVTYELDKTGKVVDILFQPHSF